MPSGSASDYIEAPKTEPIAEGRVIQTKAGHKAILVESKQSDKQAPNPVDLFRKASSDYQMALMMARSSNTSLAAAALSKAVQLGTRLPALERAAKDYMRHQSVQRVINASLDSAMSIVPKDFAKSKGMDKKELSLIRDGAKRILEELLLQYAVTDEKLTDTEVRSAINSAKQFVQNGLLGSEAYRSYMATAKGEAAAQSEVAQTEGRLRNEGILLRGAQLEGRLQGEAFTAKVKASEPGTEAQAQQRLDIWRQQQAQRTADQATLRATKTTSIPQSQISKALSDLSGFMLEDNGVEQMIKHYGPQEAAKVVSAASQAFPLSRKETTWLSNAATYLRTKYNVQTPTAAQQVAAPTATAPQQGPEAQGAISGRLDAVTTNDAVVEKLVSESKKGRFQTSDDLVEYLRDVVADRVGKSPEEVTEDDVRSYLQSLEDTFGPFSQFGK